MKLLGIIVILVSFFFLKVKLDLYKVQTEGKIVQMTILDLPKDCSVRNSSMQLQYENKRYFKKTKSNICQENKIGDTIQMKYMIGVDEVLYPTESILGEFVAISIFVALGLTSIVFGFKRKTV